MNLKEWESKLSKESLYEAVALVSGIKDIPKDYVKSAIDYFAENGKYKEAIYIAKMNGMNKKVREILEKYVSHLIKKGEYYEAARLSDKLGHYDKSLWEKASEIEERKGNKYKAAVAAEKSGNKERAIKLYEESIDELLRNDKPYLAAIAAEKAKKNELSLGILKLWVDKAPLEGYKMKKWGDYIKAAEKIGKSKEKVAEFKVLTENIQEAFDILNDKNEYKILDKIDDVVFGMISAKILGNKDDFEKLFRLIVERFRNMKPYTYHRIAEDYRTEIEKAAESAEEYGLYSVSRFLLGVKFAALIDKALKTKIFLESVLNLYWAAEVAEKTNMKNLAKELYEIDVEIALKNANKLERLDISFIPIYHAAVALERAGKIDRALKLYKKSLSLLKKKKCYLEMARCYYLLGERDKAKEIIEKLIEELVEKFEPEDYDSEWYRENITPYYNICNEYAYERAKEEVGKKLVEWWKKNREDKIKGYIEEGEIGYIYHELKEDIDNFLKYKDETIISYMSKDTLSRLIDIYKESGNTSLLYLILPFAKVANLIGEIKPLLESIIWDLMFYRYYFIALQLAKEYGLNELVDTIITLIKEEANRY
jgi:tetratricopeptide (TPR) repeat protein